VTLPRTIRNRARAASAFPCNVLYRGISRGSRDARGSRSIFDSGLVHSELCLRKTELQAELEQLRKQVGAGKSMHSPSRHSASSDDLLLPPASTSTNVDATSDRPSYPSDSADTGPDPAAGPCPIFGLISSQDQYSTQLSSTASELLQSAAAPSLHQFPTSMTSPRVAPTQASTTRSQTVQDLIVDAQDVDGCFEM
jgi:hypothetical protein